MTWLGALALCLAALALARREQRSAAEVAAGAAAPSDTSRPARRSVLGPPPATPDAPRPAGGPEAPFVATPLFEPRARLALGLPAALTFSARDRDSGEPVVREDVAVALIHLPERTETRLPVREVRPGVYQAELTPEAPGQYLVAVSSAGLPVPTTAPLSVGVPGAVGGGREPAGEEAGPVSARWRRPGRPGAGERGPRRGR